MSEIRGIFPSEIIIKSAISAALRDMRRKPYLLDYVFNSLLEDELTFQKYGQKTVDLAKAWFTATKIKIYSNVHLEGAEFPCITMALSGTSEAEATLGDTHYVPRETVDTVWPDLTTKFTPTLFVQSTGLMEVPDLTSKQVRLEEGLFIVTKEGIPYEITEVLDDTSFRIKPNVGDDFTDSVIKAPRPAFTAHIESIFNKESWVLGCHVQTEPMHLTFLHSIVSFAIQRYKQSLLEKRGFERSSFNSSDFTKNPHFETQNVYSRYITLSGYVQQVWVKEIAPNVTSTDVYLGVDLDFEEPAQESLDFFDDEA